MSACPGCEVEIADYVRHCGATWCAGFAAGRASVIESEGMQTAWSYLLDYATATGDLASECEYAGHPPESVARIRERAAAIRAALEALR